MQEVSVIIPTYNYGRFIAQTIDSALGQTLPPREVIVVDDGSTDSTPEILARYGERIRVIRKQNGGVAAARNTGAEAAAGDLLAFLDADDIWLPQKLERQVQRFEEEPTLGLVHCGMQWIDAEGNPTGEGLVNGMEGWVAEEMLRFRRTTIIAPGGTTLVPRRIFQELGGFDPRLPPSEDWDFSYRVASRYKVGFVPEALLLYRLHGVNGHLNVSRMERAMLLAYEKAFSGADSRLRRLRRRCYGNLHMVLAGSFFRAGQYRDFARHLLKSLWLTPDNGAHALGFPLRWWRRRCQGT